MKSYIALSFWTPQKGCMFSGVRMDFDRKGNQMFTKIHSSSEIVDISKCTNDIYFVETERSYYLVFIVNTNSIQNLPIFGYAKKVRLGKKAKLELVGWEAETGRVCKTGRVVITDSISEIIKYGDNVYILISGSNVYYAMVR